MVCGRWDRVVDRVNILLFKERVAWPSLGSRLEKPPAPKVSQSPFPLGKNRALANLSPVIITSSSDAKLEEAKKLGADFTVNYRTTPGWEAEVMRVTDNHGADIILETGGAQTLRKSFDCIAFGGLIDCIGYVSGKVDTDDDRMNVNLLALRRTVTLKGIINGPNDRFKEMLRFYEAHQIHPVVNRVFSFAESKEAFKFLESGSHFGKVVIKVE